MLYNATLIDTFFYRLLRHCLSHMNKYTFEENVYVLESVYISEPCDMIMQLITNLFSLFTK